MPAENHAASVQGRDDSLGPLMDSPVKLHGTLAANPGFSAALAPGSFRLVIRHMTCHPKAQLQNIGESRSDYEARLHRKDDAPSSSINVEPAVSPNLRHLAINKPILLQAILRSQQASTEIRWPCSSHQPGKGCPGRWCGHRGFSESTSSWYA